MLSRREKVHLYVTLANASFTAGPRPLDPNTMRLRWIMLGLAQELGYPDPSGLTLAQLLAEPLHELAGELVEPANDNGRKT
jgi:hypothetical protein